MHQSKHFDGHAVGCSTCLANALGQCSGLRQHSIRDGRRRGVNLPAGEPRGGHGLRLRGRAHLPARPPRVHRGALLPRRLPLREHRARRSVDDPQGPPGNRHRRAPDRPAEGPVRRGHRQLRQAAVLPDLQDRNRLCPCARHLQGRTSLQLPRRRLGADPGRAPDHHERRQRGTALPRSGYARRNRAPAEGGRRRRQPAAHGRHGRRHRRSAGEGAVCVGAGGARADRRPGQRRGRRIVRPYLGRQGRGLGPCHAPQPALGLPVHARGLGAHARAALRAHRQPLVGRARGHAVGRLLRRQLRLWCGQGCDPWLHPRRGARTGEVWRHRERRGPRPDRDRAHRAGVSQDRASGIWPDPRDAAASHRCSRGYRECRAVSCAVAGGR